MLTLYQLTLGVTALLCGANALALPYTALQPGSMDISVPHENSKRAQLPNHDPKLQLEGDGSKPSASMLGLEQAGSSKAAKKISSIKETRILGKSNLPTGPQKLPEPTEKQKEEFKLKPQQQHLPTGTLELPEPTEKQKNEFKQKQQHQQQQQQHDKSLPLPPAQKLRIVPLHKLPPPPHQKPRRPVQKVPVRPQGKNQLLHKLPLPPKE